MTVREALDREWAEFKVEKNSQGKLTQAENWRRANPGEWYLLSFYRAGGDRPSLVTSTGKQMVEHVTAWHLTAPAPTPNGPAPPVGPFQVREGNGTVQSFPDCWKNTESELTVAKKHVKNVQFAGVGSQFFWPPKATYPRTTITDVIVEGVSKPAPGASGGTGEAGAWLGNPTTLQRAEIRRCAWMGINIVGRSQGSLIEDVLIEDCPVGGYFELATHDVTLRRVFTRNIRTTPVAGGTEPDGLLAGRSFTFEWWHRFPEYGGVIGPYNVTFEDCDIYCPPRDPRFEFDPCAGIYIGPGCYGIKAVRCRFWGPGWAVLAPTVRANNGADVKLEDCVFEQDGPDLSYHNLPMGA